jgi:hypothetical protein
MIEDIMKLGYDRETAELMARTFQNEGGLSCLRHWPEEFSLFSGKRSVLDVLLAHGQV